MDTVLQWLYELFGADFPRLSLVIITLVFATSGGILGYTGWRKIAKDYENSQQTKAFSESEFKRKDIAPPQPKESIEDRAHKPSSPTPLSPKTEHPRQAAQPQGETKGNSESEERASKGVSKTIPQLPVWRLSYTEEPASSNREDAPYATKVVIQTNVVRQPTSLVVVCSAEVAGATYYLTGSPAMIMSGDGYIDKDKRLFWFVFSGPPFRPETPIVVLLMAKEPIRVLSVRQGPPSPFQ